jgi:ribonuclease R
MSLDPTRHRAFLRQVARRAMFEYGLEPDFSAAALAEIRGLGSLTSLHERRRDLRALLWASIDNDDSRDLDQLTVARPAADGVIDILVAVADVDELVPKGCALDEHAGRNTTSVYTEAENFPMLPELLSTDMTSLNPGQDRAALVIEMGVAPDGTIRGEAVYGALVRNQAQLAYNAVAAWLDGEGPMPVAMARVPGLDGQIRMQDRVACLLGATRHEQGALDLDTAESHAVFDGDVIRDFEVEHRNRAHGLIENFMIFANGATARFLESRGVPSIRRIVRSPKRWDRIVSVAAALGGHLPAEPDARALQQFLDARRSADPLRFPDLSLAIVKLIGSGEYDVERPGEDGPGHFGLATRDYTHSTAPNRRYPDLITQRLVKATLAGRPAPYSVDELHELAVHCTVKEDDASKVARMVHKSAAALLLATHKGERFEGVVTGASAKGTWVRILGPAVEGRVVEGAEGIDVGDRIRVRLVATDPEKGFIDFAAWP